MRARDSACEWGARGEESCVGKREQKTEEKCQGVTVQASPRCSLVFLQRQTASFFFPYNNVCVSICMHIYFVLFFNLYFVACPHPKVPTAISFSLYDVGPISVMHYSVPNRKVTKRCEITHLPLLAFQTAALFIDSSQLQKNLYSLLSLLQGRVKKSHVSIPSRYS